MSTERFEEIVSRYADGAATPDELAELERMMRERTWYEGLYALSALRAIQPGKY